MSLAKYEGGAENDTLLLRAMRQKNKVGTFYKKMASLWKVHKNRQIAVDFIP
jgi:hypothetical protein